ncbi:hypothetical protein Tco_1109537 [Tanacetum coccineum]
MKGLSSLACEEDVCCLATLVRCFMLIEVYIKHGVTALYSYLMAPRFRATLKEINDEPAGSIAANRTEKMLLLTWHESSETPKEHVCDSITPSSLPQPDCILTLPTDESVITYTQLSGVQGVDTQSHVLIPHPITSSRLSHDESFRVDDLDLNLNEEPDVNLNVSQVETQSELPVSEEPDVGRSQEPILAERFELGLNVEDVVLEDYVISGEEAAYLVKMQVQADDDMDRPFDNICVTNLVSNDVLEGEDVDVHPISGWFTTLIHVKENKQIQEKANDRVYLHSIESKRNLKLYKNDGVRIRARCDGKVLVFIMSHGDGPTGPNHAMEPGPSGSSGPTTRIQDQLQRKLEVQISMSKAFRAKAIAEREIKGYHKRSVRLRWCFHEGAISRPSDCSGRLDSTMEFTPLAYAWLKQRKSSCAGYLAKSGLLLTNICEVFNGKIVGGRDKPVITLLEYIREYCMKRIMNVQDAIDKCTGLLTPTATRIIESIKKEAHLMKVQWNRANKYQVSGSLACWNMALNDWATPPTETWEKSTCPTTLLPPNATGASCRSEPRKKRKRSKHEDESFVKDGKLSRKGGTITCQSCRNTGHNKAACKGQGRKAATGGNNAEASGSASRQAHQTEPAAGQDGSGGSGVGAVIGLSTAAGEGGQGSVGVANQGSSHNRWTKSKVQTERMSLHKRTPTQPASQPSTSFQVPVSEIRNADGRERWCTNTIKCSRWCK